MHLLRAFYVLEKGDRPLQPLHLEVSDEAWRVIEGCWDNDPSLRPPIKTVVTTLEEEISRDDLG